MSYHRDKSLDKNCKHCSEEFIPVNWQNTYCSVECRKKAEGKRKIKSVKKRCVVCDEEFVSPKGNWKTCSPECKEIHFKIKNKIWQRRYMDSDKCKVKRKEYYKMNAEEIKEKSKAYHYNKMKTDPNYRMLFRLRQRLQAAVKQGFTSEWILEILGCSLNELRDHLQQTAIENGYPDFNIDDYSGQEFHIDHIRPCAKFDLLEEKDQRKCFHFGNLQILSAKKNMTKHAKYIEDEL